MVVQPANGVSSSMSCGQFGAGTSDMKAALGMLIAFFLNEDFTRFIPPPLPRHYTHTVSFLIEKTCHL